MKKIFVKKKENKGYAILFTVIIVSAISVITAGLTNVAYKQLILSSLAKDSQSAFYQADTASDCALYADRVESLKTPPNIFTTGAFNCGGSDLVVSTPSGDGDYTIYPVEDVNDSLNSCFRIDVSKTPSSGSPTSPTVPTPPAWHSGLVSWWKLDANGNDYFGLNSGSIIGATNTSTGCKSGLCYNFDRNNDYLEAPNSSSLNITGNQVSISAWFTTDLNSETTMLVSKPVSSGAHSAPYFSYNLQQYGYGSDDYPRMWITTSGNPSGVSTSYTGDVLEIGQLYNVIGVYDGTKVCTYLNGVLLGSCVAASGNITGYNTPLRIGVNGGLTEDFNGKIDEVMLWNRALNPSEVQEIYSAFNPITSWQSGLVSWWKFDGDPTDSISSNDGTLMNGLVDAIANCVDGGCYDFDGVDDYINVGNPASLQLNGAMTLSGWGVVDTVNNRRIIGKIGSSPNNGWSLNMEGGAGNEFAFMLSGTGSDLIYLPSVADASDYLGQLVHLVGVYDPVAGAMRLYINGVLNNEITTGVPATQFNSSMNVNIGRHPNGCSNCYWDGLMDEVMVWDRALSGGEIQDLYNALGGTVGATVQTTISAKGYNICDVNNLRTVEREIKIDYEE